MKSSNKIVIITIVIIMFIVATILAFSFLKSLNRPVTATNITMDATYRNSFITGEYLELKDYGKSYLTIVVAVFVASITFSEKIVDLKTASAISRFLIFSCWILLLLSIVLIGLGLAFLFQYYYSVLYYSKSNQSIYRLSALCYILSGLSFGFALTSMLAAGVSSFLESKKKQEEKSLLQQTPLGACRT